MKLNEIDYKLLAYLYHNNREPNSKIAKDIGISRKQVEYKIKNYLASELIRKFFLFCDYKKLGYNYLVVVLLKFEISSSINEYFKGLFKNKNCISFGKAFGKYDLYANLIFKDEKEFSGYLSSLLSHKKYPIYEYLSLKPIFTELYPIKIFGDYNKDNYLLVNEDSKKVKLDDKDKKILMELENDARKKISEIAIKLDISPELALYKIKRLYREKIILGSRAEFNMEKLGYSYSIILLNVRNLSEEVKTKLINFTRNSKYANSLSFSLSRPNCFIQFFHKTEAEFKENIDRVRELLKDEHFDMDIIMLNEDERLNTLPFLDIKKTTT